MPKGHSLFTREQAVWFKTLFPRHGGAETARMMNAWFGTSFTAEQIDAAAPGRRGSWLTPEVKAWLREHIHERSLAGTAEELYRVFGIRVRVGQLNSANTNHKFGKANRNVIRAYSEEEFAWLFERLPQGPRAEVRAAFRERFGRDIALNALDNFVTRHGCRGAPNTGCFKPGDPRSGLRTPKQKAAFVEGGKKTRFKKGHKGMPSRTFPLYAERWRYHSRAGRNELFIKVPGPSPYAAHKKTGWSQDSHWVRKAVWVWEQANGPVPKGHAVVQLDGDPADCEPENLDCVPQAVLARLNAYHAPAYAGPDANPARVRIAQIKQAIATRGETADEDHHRAD